MVYLAMESFSLDVRFLVGFSERIYACLQMVPLVFCVQALTGSRSNLAPLTIYVVQRAAQNVAEFATVDVPPADGFDVVAVEHLPVERAGEARLDLQRSADDEFQVG